MRCTDAGTTRLQFAAFLAGQRQPDVCWGSRMINWSMRSAWPAVRAPGTWSGSRTGAGQNGFNQDGLRTGPLSARFWRARAIHRREPLWRDREVSTPLMSGKETLMLAQRSMASAAIGNSTG